MHTQLAQLLEHLENHGWRRQQVLSDQLSWWADEIWRIESDWTPTGFALFLTFLVDPLHDGPRRQGEGVWAIGTAKELPGDRQAAEGKPLIPIAPQWEKRLPSFLEGLDKLREAAV